MSGITVRNITSNRRVALPKTPPNTGLEAGQSIVYSWEDLANPAYKNLRTYLSGYLSSGYISAVITNSDEVLDATSILTVSATNVVQTEYSDYLVQVPITGGVASAGTWAASLSSNHPIITHTAAAASQHYIVPLVVPFRNTDLKGLRLKSIRAKYETSTAAADDIQFHILSIAIGAQGSSDVVTVLAGDVNGDYDSAHDTAAERVAFAGAPTKHLLTVTIPEDERVYLDELHQLFIKVLVDGDAGATNGFVLKALEAAFDYVPVDAN